MKEPMASDGSELDVPRSANESHAPVTTHPIGMHWPWESFRNEKWLDFIIYQSGHGDDDDTLRWIHSGPPSRHWQDSPARPIINIEPPYEGHLGISHANPIAIIAPGGRFTGAF